MSHTIILGDVHLGKGVNIGRVGVGANLNSRIADQLNLLDWVLDQAHHRDVSNIVITGDIFEEPKPHPSLITMFLAWLKKCQAYNIHVHIILGNHDLLRFGSVFISPLDIISEVELENISVYKDINTIFIGTQAITLLPFRDRKSFSAPTHDEAISLLADQLTYELASIPVTYKKIVVGHLAIEGSIPVGDEIDDLSNELFCPLSMFNGYDYVWMGHVHKPQVMQHKKAPYIAHVGSMDISNFGETDQKKHIIVIHDNASEKFFETVEIPTRPLKKITITVPAATEDTTAYVIKQLEESSQDFSQAIVKVEVSLSDPELQSINKSSVEKYIVSQGAFNITNISESKKIALIKRDDTNTIDTQMDVPAAINKYADTYIDADMKDAFIEEALDVHNTFLAEAKE